MRIISDILLAFGLFCALMIVFALDLWRAPAQNEPNVAMVSTAPIIPEPEPLPVRKLRLGVTPREPEYDDMGKLLDTLGDGYRYTAFELDDLLEPGKLDEYDVIFVTCGNFGDRWLAQRIGDAERGAGGSYRPNDDAFLKARENLRKFVGRGGTLYASDLRYPLVARSFPEFANRSRDERGATQKIEAQVVDPGLMELLGPGLELTFDQPAWYPAHFNGKHVAAMIRGTFKTNDGEKETVTAPLLVKFPFEEGAVIFTSFHNEKQNSESETKLLRYLVFSAMTAKVEAQVAKTMMKGGFSPAKQGLYSASQGQQAARQVYHCTKVADLQFVLGFENAGARLRLSIEGPGDKKLEKEGTSTIILDVPAAAVGAWNYTVTAITLPNENFPFTVTVGQK